MGGVLSSVRELSYNAAEDVLLAYPVDEYATLRQSPALFEVSSLALSGTHMLTVNFSTLACNLGRIMPPLHVGG